MAKLPPRPPAARNNPGGPKRPTGPIVPGSVTSKTARNKPGSKSTALLRGASAKSANSASKAEIKSARALLRQQLRAVQRVSTGSPLRRGIIYSSIGSILLLVGLVLATIFTPMMAIEKIDIVGLNRLKKDTVYAAVKSLVGTPLTLVDENQIQKRLANFSLIESFTTVSLPPHTLQLNIQERQPIGIVTIGTTHYLYDPAGVQIGPTASTSKYPKILLNGDPAHSSSYREAVSVLLALPTSLYPSVASIQATSVDDVRIRLRGVANKQILWGDATDSVLKSKVLSALMANVKRNASVVFDVSSPTAPTVRYGNF